MAILVSDSFNRANDPTSLGTADTGQVWSVMSGPTTAFGVVSNEAVWTWDAASGDGIVVVESGATNGITSITLLNPETVTANFGIGYGVVFRFIDTNYYWQLAYTKHSAFDTRVRLQRIYAGLKTTAVDINSTFLIQAPSGTIKVAYCNQTFNVYINDVLEGTYDDSGNPQNYGTMCGLMGTPGTYFLSFQKEYDDFLVTTNGACEPTYNCIGGACVDPGDGTGTYATLAECLTGCSVAASFNCLNGRCFDPGDGSGTYPTLAACEDSGCGGGSRGVATMEFDEGQGNFYYLVPPIVDSGDELRSKVVKAIRVTGKKTNASVLGYGYDVETPINVTDLEEGTNSATGALPLTNSTQVAQSERQQVNIPNAVLHTMRVQGDDTGETTRDRIDEIVTEQAEQGVRR